MIDTHTHLFDEAFDADRKETVERALAAGVVRLYLPNVDDTSVAGLLELCALYPDCCFPLIGFHPTEVNTSYRPRLDAVKAYLQPGHPFVGIGEIGIDLHWDQSFLKEQQQVLDEQLQWAIEWNLPVVIHCRDAYPELFEVMAPYKHSALRGIFHSFAGTAEEAEALLDYSHFMLGINGVITFKKSKLPEVVRNIPLQRMVLETDSPYLAPIPHRGQRNESAYIVHVARTLADVLQIPLQTIEKVTSDNAISVFGLRNTKNFIK